MMMDRMREVESLYDGNMFAYLRYTASSSSQISRGII